MSPTPNTQPNGHVRFDQGPSDRKPSAGQNEFEQPDNSEEAVVADPSDGERTPVSRSPIQVSPLSASSNNSSSHSEHDSKPAQLEPRRSSAGGIPTAAGIQLGQKAMDERRRRHQSEPPGARSSSVSGRRRTLFDDDGREHLTARNTVKNIGRGVIPPNLLDHPFYLYPFNVSSYPVPLPAANAHLRAAGFGRLPAGGANAENVRPRTVRPIGMAPRPRNQLVQERRGTDATVKTASARERRESDVTTAEDFRRDSSAASTMTEPPSKRRSLSEVTADTVRGSSLGAKVSEKVKSVKDKVSQSLPKSSGKD